VNKKGTGTFLFTRPEVNRKVPVPFLFTRRAGLAVFDAHHGEPKLG